MPVLFIENSICLFQERETAGSAMLPRAAALSRFLPNGMRIIIVQVCELSFATMIRAFFGSHLFAVRLA